MVYFTTRNDRSLSNPGSLWKTWDDFAHQFDSFFADFDRSAGENKSEHALASAPATDVEETESHYDLSFDMPGIPKENLNVEVKGRTLSVSGRRERTVNDKKLHRSEKFYGEYRRTITLPENIKEDAIEASYENGVLQIRLPKAELAGAKKIQIGSTLKSSPKIESKSAH